MEQQFPFGWLGHS